MGQFLTGLKIFLAIPDKKKSTAAIDAQIIIGTPGKIYDLVGKRRLNLQKLRVLVLDEADDLLTGADKQADHTNNVLKALKAVKYQKLLFSATWPEEVKNWAKANLLRKNERNALLTLQTEELTVSTISQFYLRSNTENAKIELVDTLFAFLNIGQALIFVSTRASAQRLAETLQKRNHSVSLIHGGTMDPMLRDKAIDSFRSGNTKILVSTDLLSRGIDVLMVNLVINFDLPSDPQTYLHRIGRTGRFGKKGVAINLAQDALDLEILQGYSKIYNKEIVEIKEDEIPTKLANSITQTFEQYK
jgi:ATP-dependent RNA helicase DDX19/DBP5